MLKSKLKVKLAEREIKQQELSEILGVTKQTMSLWVTGKSTPTLETAFKIANLLDCKVDDLFTYNED
jgi:DNA-binding XRE family transcriptional regulator